MIKKLRRESISIALSSTNFRLHSSSYHHQISIQSSFNSPHSTQPKFKTTYTVPRKQQQASISIKTMSTAARKILVVFGATGAQGGSVAKAILSDPALKSTWTVRGVTRDVTKSSAKALEALGAETVAVSPHSSSNPPI